MLKGHSLGRAENTALQALSATEALGFGYGSHSVIGSSNIQMFKFSKDLISGEKTDSGARELVLPQQLYPLLESGSWNWVSEHSAAVSTGCPSTAGVACHLLAGASVTTV